MEDNTKKMLMAAGVGVGATAAVATAMYFLGGREAPHVPSLGELGAFGKREIGFGALHKSVASLIDEEAPGPRRVYAEEVEMETRLYENNPLYRAMIKHYTDEGVNRETAGSLARTHLHQMGVSLW